MTSGANADVAEAIDWYAKHSIEAASRFLLALETAIEAIARQPERFPVAFDGVRSERLHRFPFSVQFEVGAHGIRVFGIVHDRRGPHRPRS